MRKRQISVEKTHPIWSIYTKNSSRNVLVNELLDAPAAFLSDFEIRKVGLGVKTGPTETSFEKWRHIQ